MFPLILNHMITIKKYYKTTCAPCISMGRILERAQKKADFNVENIEVIENPDLAEQAGVKAVPTIIVESDGAEVIRWQGVKSSKEVKEIIEMYS